MKKKTLASPFVFMLLVCGTSCSFVPFNGKIDNGKAYYDAVAKVAVEKTKAVIGINAVSATGSRDISTGYMVAAPDGFHFPHEQHTRSPMPEEKASDKQDGKEADSVNAKANKPEYPKGATCDLPKTQAVTEKGKDGQEVVDTVGTNFRR